MHFDKLIKTQIRNPNTIPIIVINFNQLFYLQKLVDFLLERKFENIIIVDNLSTYPPLLEYYQTLKGVTIEYMDDNYGHMVFFENKALQEKYGKGFYVVTDADIVPNENLPENFMRVILGALRKNDRKINKVGFALRTDDIPDAYLYKEKVIVWEKKFWQTVYHDLEQSFFAKIDTTFALYKPGYPQLFDNVDFLSGIRIAGNFTAVHGGWYVDPQNMTAEQEYYQETSSNASSWLIKKNGSLDAKHASIYSGS